jgi:hypothetical protein
MLCLLCEPVPRLVVTEEAVAIFISYSSQDRSAIDNLLGALRKTKKPLWFDEELAGGEAWWRVILDQIRSCEVFLVAVSDHSLGSKPCQAELGYAQALHRPILPVQIGPIDSMRANPLAAVQLIDYQNPAVETSIQLLTAVYHLWDTRPPLPEPLPEEPPVPFEYLLRLSIALEGSDLSAHQQSQLFTELRSALEDDGQDPVVRRDVTRLLVILRNRSDVAWKTRTDVDRLLTSIGAPAADAVRQQADAPAASLPTVPSGPQPSFQTSQPTFHTNQPAFPSDQPTFATRPSFFQTPPRPPGSHSGPMPQMGPQYNTPPGGGGPYAQPANRHRKRWVIAGVSGLAAAAAIAVVVLLVLPPPPPPPKLFPFDQLRLDSTLLTPDQVNTIMGVTTMQAASSPTHNVFDTPFGANLADQDCRGALLPIQTPVYQTSGYSGVSVQVVEDSTQSPDHVVVQSAVGFPSIKLAQDFMNTSATKWQACAGKVVADNPNGQSKSGWAFGILTGTDPKLSQLETQEAQSGWQCQRALDRAANLIVDVSACGYHVSDQADRIAAKMIGNATS